jgi:endonuclease YncB( thermonuclease family)
MISQRATHLVFGLLALASCSLGVAGSITGRVVGVSDGDSITVLNQHSQQYKIRLSGIDAPEKRQDFGARSKQSLSEMVYRQVVTVDTHKTDRYGRTVGKVLLGERDVNLEQLRRGMAWHYKAYEREQIGVDRTAYAAAESAARQSGTGLWAMPHPTAPWNYRRNKRDGLEATVAP